MAQERADAERLLSLTGKFPGTGKHRGSLVNYELQLEMRDTPK